MMKTKTIEAVTQLIRDGRVECLTDLKLGTVEIRWTRTGKREHINVTRKYRHYAPDIGVGDLKQALGRVHRTTAVCNGVRTTLIETGSDDDLVLIPGFTI